MIDAGTYAQAAGWLRSKDLARRPTYRNIHTTPASQPWQRDADDHGYVGAHRNPKSWVVTR